MEITTRAGTVVLFVADDAILRQGVIGGGINFISKSFALGVLSRDQLLEGMR